MIAIVGAGIAGLSIASALKRRLGADQEICVFERAPRAGGNIRTDDIDGFLIEWGPNGFLDNVPETFRLVDALGLRERVVRSSDSARRRFIYRGGHLHEVPTGPLSFATSRLPARFCTTSPTRTSAARAASKALRSRRLMSSRAASSSGSSGAPARFSVSTISVP